MTKVNLARMLPLAALAWSLQGGTGAALVRAIRENGLDAGECYRVRDISLARDEAQVFLSDGYLIFGKPVGDTRVTAVFATDAEGDGELLLLPPNRAERSSLAKHTGAPNLDEHFTAAVLAFSGDTYRDLMEQITANAYIKKSPEMGALLAGKWSSVASNVGGSFSIRLAMDLLAPAGRKGFFAAAVSGNKLGAFDLVYEPRAREQLMAGQSSAAGFDIWTSFTSRTFRAPGGADLFRQELQILSYKIETVLDAALKLHCVTRVKVRPLPGNEAALPFEISGQMRVTEARVDGEPAEVLAPDEPRGSMTSSGNNLFVVAPATRLTAGEVHEVEIRHEGAVVSDAGNRVYFVNSRGNWFPGRGLQFALFDLTFRYPKDLTLVSTGEPMEETAEGDQKTTHRVTQFPVRLAGFNLGNYEGMHLQKNGLRIEVWANRNAEHALEPKAAAAPPPSAPATLRRPRPSLDTLPSPVPPVPAPSTTAHLQTLAADIGDVMEFYSARFGTPPTKTLEVTPVPGRFGQGFPGLIYLSTLSYLETRDVFFGDLLYAHEAAHQWWGNVVTSAGYHDDWVMEALANYSSLLYLEKRKGVKARDAVLDDYKARLLVKNADGATVESAGPVVQGMRVDGNWSAVVYGKGTWIIHMLRGKLGDENFLKMLAGLRRTFEDKTISTEQFRLFCASYLPPKSIDPKLESFFDQWVYGTGIPQLKLEYKISGLKVRGAVTQSGVGDDFTADVPVEIQQGRLKPATVRVQASTEPAPFAATVKAPVTRVAIDAHGILAR